MTGEDSRYGSGVTNPSRGPRRFSAGIRGTSGYGVSQLVRRCFEPGHR